MSHYKYHVFFCTNQREPGVACCGQYNAAEIREYAKNKIKQLELSGEGSVRVNIAGCLGRCESASDGGLSAGSLVHLHRQAGCGRDY